MTTTTTTWTKLHNGSWGIKGSTSTLIEGDDVVVTKRSGETKTVTVGRIVWTDGTIAIASTGTRQPAPRARYYDEDHEDCLTFGACGPRCEYASLLAGSR